MVEWLCWFCEECMYLLLVKLDGMVVGIKDLYVEFFVLLKNWLVVVGGVFVVELVEWYCVW